MRFLIVALGILLLSGLICLPVGPFLRRRSTTLAGVPDGHLVAGALDGSCSPISTLECMNPCIDEGALRDILTVIKHSSEPFGEEILSQIHDLAEMGLMRETVGEPLKPADESDSD